MTDPIGFIGVGSQGGPMAHRIVDAGMPLVVWARRPEVLEAYTAKGATAAASVAELGAQCDHVGICVVDDADVFAITDQLIPAMQAGSRIAVHSTVLPESVVALERQCAARGVGLVEVDDVADLVAMLASPAGRSYHGAIISIDAGITAG